MYRKILALSLTKGILRMLMFFCSMTSIRRAFPADAERLTQITLAAKRHWDYPETWIQLWLPQLTISPEYISTHELWMALTEESPVAYYSFTLEPVIARSHEPQMASATKQSLWLDNLWVLPESMGQGIGRLLFQHALERCRTLGFPVLKIEADPNAQRFYEKMGARKIGEHRGEVDGQPRILPVMEVAVMV